MTAVDEARQRPAAPGDGPAPARPARRRGRTADLAVTAGYAALAGWVLSRLWRDPAGRVAEANPDDHGFFMLVLAHGERVLYHGANPLFTDRLNVPDGVNMMANTSVLALSLPVAPVTHAFGPAVALVLLLTLGLAGTATAWYAVLSRQLGLSRGAAALGGLWCGFCPAMVSHAAGHVNFVAQFVLPFVVGQVLRLREPGRAVRGGVVLGLLIVLQVFVNEETLLFTALTLGVFTAAYAVQRPGEARAVAPRFAAGLGVAALTSGVLLAYPLWWQFAGPGSYRGQPFEPGRYVSDLYSVGAYARRSLAGDAETAQRLSVSATEDNLFFGVPVLLALAVAAVVLRRRAAAVATLVAGLVLFVASLGPRLRVDGVDTGVPMPFALVAHLPVIDLVSVTRFALVPAALAGVLLALLADRIRGPRRRRAVAWAALVAAVVPVLPTPLPATPAPPLPEFVADGVYRGWVPAGRTLVPVPLPEVTSGREAMRWAAATRLAVPFPRGYFMGPAADGTGSWSAPPRPTADLLRWVAATGRVPVPTAAARAAARADLAYWRAGVVVLVPSAARAPQLEATLSGLLGRAPQEVAGVRLWDVRDLPVPPPG